MLSDFIPYISISLEALVAAIGILIAVQNKKIFGWGIALTFAVYTFWDFTDLSGLSIISPDLLSIVFLVATVSILWVVYEVYKQGKAS